MDELRHAGHLHALRHIIRAARETTTASEAAKLALQRLEGIVAIDEAKADTPELWLDGLHDMTRALRMLAEPPSD